MPQNSKSLRLSEQRLEALQGDRSNNGTPWAEGIAAGYDADGRLTGIEILDAVKRLGDPQVFKQVILEDIALGRQEQPSA